MEGQGREVVVVVFLEVEVVDEVEEPQTRKCM